MVKKKIARKEAKATRPVRAAKEGECCIGLSLGPKLKLLMLMLLFTFLAIAFFYRIVPVGLMYATLVFCAVVWFAIEAFTWRNDIGRIRKAVLVGLFLLIFDFAFENSGWLFGLWETHNSAFAIGIVPIEIMLICLIGGTAWALYLPKKPGKIQVAMDIFVFAIFGALGEHLLGLAGLMSYHQWWNMGWAIIAYAGTWVILHYVRRSAMDR